MADKYTEGFDAKPKKALYQGAGVKTTTVAARAEIAAADGDGQLYVLARGVPLDATLMNVMLPKGFPAITGGTDYDIGVYKNTGTYAVPVWTEVDKDIILDGYNFSSGSTTAIDIATSPTDQTLAELCSLTSEKFVDEYAVVLTANTVGSAAVDLEMNLVFAPGN